MTCKICPLHEEYRFKSACTIETCKFHSKATRNRCLALDIVFSAEDRNISDAELVRYKFGDMEVTVKDVAKYRKRAVARVKSMIMLHRLIKMIRDQYSADEGMSYSSGRSRVVDSVLGKKPLSIQLLEFEPWMLKFLVDDKLTEGLVGSSFSLKDALRLKTKELSALRDAVKVMCSGRSLFDTIV